MTITQAEPQTDLKRFPSDMSETIESLIETRDELLYGQFMSGIKCAALARRYKISTADVYEILGREMLKAAAKKPKEKKDAENV